MIRENFLGVEVACVNMQTTLNEVDNIIAKGEPGFIVAINPEKIMKASADEKLRMLLNSAAIQIPDGIGVVYASKLNHGSIKSRVTGIDLMEKICEQASKKNYKIFMLGAKPGVAEQAASLLREKYKGLEIVGIMDGYFKEDHEAILKIKEKKPDILFVAMGSPKQEYWITSNMSEMNVPLCMGVGGSYDVICGNIERAPDFMCKMGLEWFYRLIKEPWRFKRMLVLPKFFFKIIGERVKK
jgi:N-acetylglucosaminyldiphosphoundecaprenol N-acetyl-beta-D-mannosaminyltransferase